MIEKKVKKFESKVRINELKPRETLLKAGLKEDDKVLDLGAGTGLFSFISADITENQVYALDVSDIMIEYISKRQRETGKNIIARKVDEENNIPLEDDLLNFTIMVTVFHEIKDRKYILEEIYRTLKEKGRLLIIEFHKKETDYGPPLDEKIEEIDLIEELSKSKFKKIKKVLETEKFYGIVFEKE